MFRHLALPLLLLPLFVASAFAQTAEPESSALSAPILDEPTMGELYAKHLFELSVNGELAELGDAMDAMTPDALWDLLALFRAELDLAHRFVGDSPDGFYNMDDWHGKLLPRPDQDSRQHARAIMALAEDRLGILEYDRVVVGRFMQFFDSISIIWLDLQDEFGNHLIAYDMVSTIVPRNFRYNQHDRLRIWLKRDWNFPNTWAIIKIDILDYGYYLDYQIANPPKRS